jgi:hypothetical protein
MPELIKVRCFLSRQTEILKKKRLLHRNLFNSTRAPRFQFLSKVPADQSSIRALVFAEFGEFNIPVQMGLNICG